MRMVRNLLSLYSFCLVKPFAHSQCNIQAITYTLVYFHLFVNPVPLLSSVSIIRIDCSRVTVLSWSSTTRLLNCLLPKVSMAGFDLGWGYAWPTWIAAGAGLGLAGCWVLD